MKTGRQSNLSKVAMRFCFALPACAIAALVLDQSAGRCRRESAIAEAIQQVSRENLQRDVANLSKIGSRFKKVSRSSGIRESRDAPPGKRDIAQNLRQLGMTLPTRELQILKLEYLEKELLKLGLQPVRQPFESNAFGSGINLYAEQTGIREPDEILDVSAHYDSYPGSPGADDNNSGVAGVLEIARTVTRQGALDRSIRFVFFDLEELGLIGSRTFVESFKKGILKQPAALLNLEMIGFFTEQPNTQQTPARIPLVFDPPTTGNTIVTVGNFRSYRQARRLDGTLRAYVPELPAYSVARWGGLIGSASRSDHLAYWENKVPATMLTDTANFRNPNYHQPSDVPETLNYHKMEQVVQGAAAFVLDWATDPR